jgi:hypothetical protein
MQYGREFHRPFCNGLATKIAVESLSQRLPGKWIFMDVGGN